MVFPGRPQMNDSRGGKGLDIVRTLYVVGAVIALMVILGNLGAADYERQRAEANITYAVLYLLWGGLIWAMHTSHSRRDARLSRERCSERLVLSGSLLRCFYPRPERNSRLQQTSP